MAQSKRDPTAVKTQFKLREKINIVKIDTTLRSHGDSNCDGHDIGHRYGAAVGDCDLEHNFTSKHIPEINWIRISLRFAFAHTQAWNTTHVMLIFLEIEICMSSRYDCLYNVPDLLTGCAPELRDSLLCL